jgi:hypothetical protein
MGVMPPAPPPRIVRLRQCGCEGLRFAQIVARQWEHRPGRLAGAQLPPSSRAARKAPGGAFSLHPYPRSVLLFSPQPGTTSDASEAERDKTTAEANP